MSRFVPKDYYYLHTSGHATPEGITYDDKINKVVITCTGTDSIIENCNYKIYGRNLINEQGI